MKRLRLAAALLCALLMLSLPVMADGFGMGDFDSDTVNKNPQVDNPNEVTPTPSTEPPQEPTGDGAGNNTGNTGEPSHELVLPQREARTGSPVRYILIGALLAGALCIAIYLFTHPAREDDPADETKS